MGSTGMSGAGMTGVSEIRGVAVPFGYSGVDTDAMFPVSGEAIAAAHGFGAALFARWRADPDFILNDPVYAGARILVADTDFGIGSSRETAVWALKGAGFLAVLAPGFGDIFRSNCVRNGVLAAVIDPAARERVHRYLTARPGAELVVDVVAGTVAGSGAVAGGADSATITEALRIDGFARHCLVSGIDEFGLLAGYQDSIDQALATAGPLPPGTRRVTGSDT
jgi:3-isopropylmalate/(R)-2-methylmalate dehydratase small subunit